MGMRDTIDRIFFNYKGILAADESTGTIEKRLASVEMECNAQTRHDYRHTLFSTSGISPFVGGVILFEETLKSPLTIEPLRAQGIDLGIKVDKGAKEYGNGTLTEGLDGLPGRLIEYRDLGATFAKWRGVIRATETSENIKANADVMAVYAKRCQEADIVPIVEPEVLMDGTHTIAKSAATTSLAIDSLFRSLSGQSVDLEKVILKPNMVVSGYDSHIRASKEQVAEETIRCFKKNVPAAVPAIAFLSGGQQDHEALENLQEINKNYAPWILSFSFGRTLQRGALHYWSEGRADSAQKWLTQRAAECSQAVGKRKEVSNVWDSGL